MVDLGLQSQWLSVYLLHILDGPDKPTRSFFQYVLHALHSLHKILAPLARHRADPATTCRLVSHRLPRHCDQSQVSDIIRKYLNENVQSPTKYHQPRPLWQGFRPYPAHVKPQMFHRSGAGLEREQRASCCT